MSDEKIRNNIKLLSKLLNADKTEQKNYFSEPREAFYSELDKNFRTIFEESSVPNKTKIFDEIIQAVDDVEIFGIFPELIGKTFIGIIGCDTNLATSIIRSITDEETAKTVSLDTNLPVILSFGDKDVIASNDVGNPIKMSQKEYSATNTLLWRNDIDIQKILHFFMIQRAAKFQNIAIIYFPAHFNPETSFAKMIAKKLDAVILCTAEKSSQIKNHKLLEYFFQLKNTSQIPASIVTGSDIDILKSDVNFKNYPIITENNVYAFLEPLNVLRRNYIFTYEIERQLLEVQYFYEQRIRQLESDKSQIVGDLVNITIAETKNAIKELELETRKNLNDTETEFEKFRGAATLLSDKAKEYEEHMKKLLGEGNIFYCTRTIDILRKIFLLAIDMGNKTLAAEYMRKLQRAGDNCNYICELIFHHAYKETVNFADVQRLKNTADNEFVRKSKLRLKELLNFSDNDYMQIARDINSIETPVEYYFRAMWEEHGGNKKLALDFYRQALKLGYAPAGKRLVELAGKDYKALQSLADQMVPEANFILGQMSQAEGKFAASDKYFKIAATKKYLPAIKILSDNFFRKRIKNWKPNKILDSDERKQLESCVNLYQYILSQEPNDLSSKEKLGDLYHALGDDRRAYSWWQQCDTASAYYNCGRLFQYQDGAFSQDLYQAEDYFRKAANMGHSKAAEELTKVESWQYSNEMRSQRRERRRHSDYKPREVIRETAATTVKSSGGWCIITSAACAALHKPDDCDELNTLRAYRDKMKSENPLIAALIEEYYRVAPELVQKISSEVDAENIFSKLWQNSIAETYNLIQEGKNHAATALYIDMVQGLCNKYDVQLSNDILEKIKEFKNNSKEEIL